MRSTNTVLDLGGVTARYGDVVALDGVCISVESGELVVLLGENGAGKTTLMRVACGLVSADEGTISRPERIGFMPQDLAIWPDLRVVEQLTMMARLAEVDAPADHIDALVRHFGLTNRRRSLARTLSGGMQRRLGLALTLVGDPPLVILDEPLAGLDLASRRSLREVVVGLTRRGCAVVVSTHDMAEAKRLADRVVVLHKGRVLANDRVEALEAEHGTDLEGLVLGLGSR